MPYCTYIKSTYLLNKNFHFIPPFLAAHFSIRASESPAHERHLEAKFFPSWFRAPATLQGTGLGQCYFVIEPIKRITSEFHWIVMCPDTLIQELCPVSARGLQQHKRHLLSDLLVFPNWYQTFPFLVVCCASCYPFLWHQKYNIIQQVFSRSISKSNPVFPVLLSWSNSNCCEAVSMTSCLSRL